MKNIFYILNGSNGATYILNTASYKSILLSLRFYKARTLKQKLQKALFSVYLSFSTRLKTKEDVLAYLDSLSSLDIDYGVDENCSVLVSPTRDKVIVHHHDEYFHKFAFSKSYANVKNEANIYALLDRKLTHFEVSKMYDSVVLDDQCSFKLSAKRSYIQGEVDITLALVEFFSLSMQKDFPLNKVISSLLDKVENKAMLELLVNYAHEYKDTLIPVGLVHRDFKPWNVKDDKGLLIFDFEEAVLDGLPLEDLFNYRIDPIIRYERVEVVYENIFDKLAIVEYERYLKQLGIEINFIVFLNLYLINRIIFWIEAKDNETSKKYVELFKYMGTRL